MGRNVWRWTGLAWRALAAACALLATGLAGCNWFDTGGSYAAYGPPIVPAYGVQMVPLDIKSYTYVPPSPVHVGDTLTFTAQLEPAADRHANVYATNTQVMFRVPLHDDGVAPDAAAGDSVFSGSGQWQAAYGTGELQAHLMAYGTKQGVLAQGYADLPLEVLP